VLSFKLAAARTAQLPENHSGSFKIGLFGRNYEWLSDMSRKRRVLIPKSVLASAWVPQGFSLGSHRPTHNSGFSPWVCLPLSSPNRKQLNPLPSHRHPFERFPDIFAKIIQKGDERIDPLKLSLSLARDASGVSSKQHFP
jgi:hypothetical protein